MTRNYEREREMIEAQSLDAKIRMFLERWSPEGDRDFEADLMQIVQRIYFESQQPFHKALATAISAQPMSPIIMRDAPSNSHG